jgi:hypothetical protein
MKFEETASFLTDFRRLSLCEKELFLKAVREINLAYAGRGRARLPRWPVHLRFRAVEGAPGVWEITWSYSGPDGRATLELIEVDGEPAIRWRRVGSHRIFRNP